MQVSARDGPHHAHRMWWPLFWIISELLYPWHLNASPPDMTAAAACQGWPRSWTVPGTLHFQLRYACLTQHQHITVVATCIRKWWLRSRTK